MIPVLLESPYAGDVDTHTEYARRCVKDSLERGEAPFASHLLYTQPGILDDSIGKERSLGICAGEAWRALCEKVVVYADYGLSDGMALGVGKSVAMWKEIEVRRIGPNPLRSSLHNTVTSTI